MDTLKKVDLFGVFLFFLEQNPVILEHNHFERENTIMSNIIFNEHQLRLLESNPNVASVSERAIQYTAEFKLRAVKENQAGKGPKQIFEENSFDIEMIGVKKAQSALSRWRKTVQMHGEQGFLEERRGKASTGRPKMENLSPDKKLAKAEARIQLLEAELTLLKKIDELERKAKKKRF